jgi:pilus assembly protein Flp/PilA
MKNLLVRLYKDEDGGELLEYALIAGLIVIAAIAAIKVFSTAVKGKFNTMADDVTNA